MEVIVAKTAEQVAALGADICSRLLRKKPDCVLGLAAGSTPLAMYQELARRNQSKLISFKRVHTFNLDEYVGLKPDHPQSYRSFMDKNFFDHTDILKKNTFLPESYGKNPLLVGAAYEKKIKSKKGIDLQVLGLGRNGHIGFNEPTSSLRSRTRIKTLAEMTIKDNSRFFKRGESQPKLGITMGIATILEARHILLLATGESKAEAVALAIEGPLSSFCPASALQLHAHATVIVDESAASRLRLRSYYDWVLSQKEIIENKHHS